MARDLSPWSGGRSQSPAEFLKDSFGNGFLDDFFNHSFFSGFSSTMRTDIKENDDDYVLEVEMPGFSKEHIRVECVQGRITISARHVRQEEEGRENMLRQERHFGRVSRSYSFDGIDEEGVHAEYRDGILKISVPKQHQSTPGRKQIDIH